MSTQNPVNDNIAQNHHHTEFGSGPYDYPDLMDYDDEGNPIDDDDENICRGCGLDMMDEGVCRDWPTCQEWID